MSETKAVSKGLADAFAAAFTAGGGTVSVQQTVPDGATTFDDFLPAAAAASPGLIFFGGEYQVGATLRAAATAAGITVPLMGGDGINDPAYITGAGPSAEGSYASGVGVPIANLPGAVKFRAAYKAAGYKAEPTDYGPYAYDATNLVIAALRKPLSGKQTLPSSIRKEVVTRLQGTDAEGSHRGDRLRPVRRYARRALHPLPRGGRAARVDAGFAVTRYPGQVGPSTALLSMLIVTPPQTSLWPPRNWWTREWFVPPPVPQRAPRCVEPVDVRCVVPRRDPDRVQQVRLGVDGGGLVGDPEHRLL